jgi:hypothetical protein
MVQIIIYSQSSFYSFDSLLKEIYQFYNIPDSICVYEECCQTKPCKKGSIIQIYKNITLPYTLDPHEKYIILYQNDILQNIESELLKIQSKESEFSATQFLKCIQNEKKKYLFFCQSFIFNQTNHENYQIIEYNQYKVNELDELKKILKYLNPYFDFQSNYLSKILFKNNYSIDYTQYLKTNIMNTTSLNQPILKEEDEESEYETITDSDDFDNISEDNTNNYDSQNNDSDDDEDDDDSDEDDDDSDDEDDEDDEDSEESKEIRKKRFKKKKMIQKRVGKKSKVKNNKKKNKNHPSQQKPPPNPDPIPTPPQKKKKQNKKKREKNMKKQLKSVGLLFFLRRMRQQFHKK